VIGRRLAPLMLTIGSHCATATITPLITAAITLAIGIGMRRVEASTMRMAVTIIVTIEMVSIFLRDGVMGMLATCSPHHCASRVI
jgi:hypothetical protein